MNKRIFSKKLIELIKAKGMNQKELAEYLNFSPETISKYCRGDSEPSISVLVKISDYFNVTLDELIIDKKKEEYLSPLALSVKGGIASFYDFIKKDLHNILKKDDANKDLIDYLIKFNKNDELFSLIECCFSKNKYKIIDEKKHSKGLVDALEDLINNSQLHKDIRSTVDDIICYYPIITDKIEINKVDLNKTVVDLQSYNQIIRPVIEEVYKELKSDLFKDFYFVEDRRVHKKLLNIKDEVLKCFIKNKNNDYAIKADELIVTDFYNTYQVNVKVNYQDLQSLLIKNEAPIEVLRYFRKNTNGEEFDNYIIECMKNNPSLVEDYKNVRGKEVDAQFKSYYYMEFCMINKLNDEIIRLYELKYKYLYHLFYNYNHNVDTPIDEERLTFGIMGLFFCDTKRLKEYCELNKDSKTWNEVLNKESTQKVLNIKFYGKNPYGDTDYNSVVLLKERYAYCLSLSVDKE